MKQKQIDGLIKGNQTLTNKVEELKEENERLVKKLTQVRRERDEFKILVNSLEERLRHKDEELKELLKDPENRMMEMISKLSDRL